MFDAESSMETYTDGVENAYAAATTAHSVSQRLKLAAQYLQVRCAEVAPGVVALAVGVTTSARELDMTSAAMRSIALQAVSLAALVSNIPVGEVDPVVLPAISRHEIIGVPPGVIVADIVELVDLETGTMTLVNSFGDVREVFQQAQLAVAQLAELSQHVDRALFAGCGVLAQRVAFLVDSITKQLQLLERVVDQLIEVEAQQ